MPESFVQQVIEQETRYVGATQIYTGPTIVQTSDPFTFASIIPPQQPNAERSVLNLTVVGVGGTDAQGVVYSGQFQIRRDANTGAAAIAITGSGLSSNQISVIRDSISITESGQQTIIQVALIPIAAVGAEFFTLTIPYDDTNIFAPTTTTIIPFLDIDGTNINTLAFPNPINVIVQSSNQKMIIDAGLLSVNTDLVTLSKNTPQSRNMIDMSVEKLAANNFVTIRWEEDGSNKDAITFRPTNIPTLSTHPDGAAFNATVQLVYYGLSAAPAVNKGLKMRVQYGIGKPHTGSHFVDPLSMFSFNLYAGTRAVYEPFTFAIDSPWYGVKARIRYNDLNYSTKNALTITNHNIFTINLMGYSVSGSFADFIMQGFGAPGVFQFNFRLPSSTKLEDYIAQLMIAMSNQIPSLCYGCNSNPNPTRGIEFVVDPKFKFAKMSDIPDFAFFNGSNPLLSGQSVQIVSNPTPITSDTNFDFDLSDKTINDFYTWIIDTFGSYGLEFDWLNTPTGDWRELPVIPVLYVQPIATETYAPVILCENNTPTTKTFVANTQFYNPLENQSTLSTSIDASGTIGSVADQIQSAIDFAIASYSSFKINPAINGTQSGLDLGFTVEASPFYEDSEASFLEEHLYATIPTTYLEVAASIFNEFAKIRLSNVIQPIIVGQFDIPLVSGSNLGQLVNTINNTTAYSSYVAASLVDPSVANVDQLEIDPKLQTSINTNSTTLTGEAFAQFVREYQFAQYPTISLLINRIRSDWSAANFTIEPDPAISLFADALPTNLVSSSTNISSGLQPKLINGQVTTPIIPHIPTANVVINYDVGFATGGGPSTTAGVQVALGGYEKNGVFFPNHSPNTFFEPVVNAVFPISFNISDANVVYLLVKTRHNTDSPFYTSVPENYTGLATYSNGSPSYTPVPFVPTDSKYTDVWNQGGTLGVPTVVAIPVYSSVIDVTIEDISTLNSINLQLKNASASLVDFGFLGINRTNSNNSQTESKVAQTYGLVLDNRGAWDVLISPEAILTADPSGTISHLGAFYKRTVLNDDEGYDFTISTSLPADIQNAVSISPLPGNPQVWVFRLEYGVKRYLAQLFKASNDQNSLTGCSFTFDFTVKGRSTGVEGIARVVVFYDFTCVFDIGLCDFFWNLVDPPRLAGPEIIQNRIDFAYQTLVGCNNLTSTVNNNVTVNAPILVTLNNIPTFRNGNALLLIKSLYTPEIQGFYFPTANQLDSIQFPDCSPLNLNLPLIRKLNKEFLLLPNQDTPINDIFEIQNLLQTAPSYLWVKPQFYFPPTDDIKDCGPNEIVVVGIGYQFKNWTNGTRQDAVMIGLNMLLPEGIYASPTMPICYRYYYNQHET